jgi:hypothetical protein
MISKPSYEFLQKTLHVNDLELNVWGFLLSTESWNDWAIQKL